MKKVVEGELVVKDYGDHINLSKQIYINCDCTSLEHIGRWIVERDVYKINKQEECNVYYETNASSTVAPVYFYSNSNFIIKILRRIIWLGKYLYRKIVLALNILLNDSCYIPVDFVWSFDTTECFNNTIIKVINEMKKYKTGYESEV